MMRGLIFVHRRRRWLAGSASKIIFTSKVVFQVLAHLKLHCIYKGLVSPPKKKACGVALVPKLKRYLTSEELIISRTLSIALSHPYWMRIFFGSYVRC